LVLPTGKYLAKNALEQACQLLNASFLV
jgi:hypothetical protein